MEVYQDRKLLKIAIYLKPCVKLHGMANDGIASRNLFKTDRIHHFDIRFFKVSFSIRPAVLLASGWTEP